MGAIIPRFVGSWTRVNYNAKAAGTTVGADRLACLEAYEEVAYRTTVTAIMTA